MNLWLYRRHIHDRHVLFHSDLLVFGLPALHALCAYTYVIRQQMMKRLAVREPTILSLSLALLPTVISTLTSLLSDLIDTARDWIHCAEPRSRSLAKRKPVRE